MKMFLEQPHFDVTCMYIVKGGAELCNQLKTPQLGLGTTNVVQF